MRVGKNVLGVFALMAAAAVVPAKAATIVYDFTSDHCTGGCGPAGTIFGNISLIESGAILNVTVHLNSGFGFAKTGSVDFQTFLFNGVGVALGDITVDAHVPVLTATSGPYTASGIGAFSFGIGCSLCGNGLSSTFTNDFTFHVANATIADLTTTLVSGTPFVADIGNLATGNTGPIDASVHSTVPEPITSGLVGTGLISLFFLRRRITGKA